jgi:hypothetical protein
MTVTTGYGWSIAVWVVALEWLDKVPQKTILVFLV